MPKRICGALNALKSLLEYCTLFSSPLIFFIGFLLGKVLKRHILNKWSFQGVKYLFIIHMSSL